VIGGVWASTGVGTALEHLSRLGREANAGNLRSYVEGRAAVGAWDQAPAGCLDEAGGFVALGSLPTRPNVEGVERVVRTRGSYALVAVHARGLLVSRGRFEGRCLYHALSASGVVLVCSRLEPLARLLARDGDLDADWLAAQVAASSFDDMSATAYRQVRRVLSAQALLLTSRGVAESARAPVDSTPSAGDPEALAEELSHHLRGAVARSLVGRRRVGVMVSGGLDSSTILAHAVAEARGASRAEVDALTLSFGAPGDDRPYLADLCDRLGIVPIRVTPRQATRNVLPSLIADGAPQTWPTSAWELKLMQRAVDRGADVVLNGVCGDQLFCGDPRVFARSALQGHLKETWLGLKTFRTHTRSTFWGRVGRYVVAPLISKTLPDLRRLKRRRAAAKRWPWAGPRLRDFLRRSYDTTPAPQAWLEESCAGRVGRLVDSEFLEVAEARGQAEVASGCTRVDPMLDDELVTFVATLPLRSLLIGGSTRGLMRRALTGVVPEAIRLRDDKGTFETALAAMIGPRELRALRGLATMQASAELGLVEPFAYQRHFEAVVAQGGSSPDWMAIWPALAVEAFARSHLATPAAERGV